MGDIVGWLRSSLDHAVQSLQELGAGSAFQQFDGVSGSSSELVASSNHDMALEQFVDQSVEVPMLGAAQEIYDYALGQAASSLFDGMSEVEYGAIYAEIERYFVRLDVPLSQEDEERLRREVRDILSFDALKLNLPKV